MKKTTSNHRKTHAGNPPPTLLCGLAMAALTCFATTGRAATININVGNAASANAMNGRSYITGGLAQSPVAYSGTGWNDISSTPNYSVPALLDSNGNTTAVAFATISPTAMEGPLNWADHANVPLLQGGIKRNNNSSTGNAMNKRAQVSGLTAGNLYHIAVIGCWNDTAAGEWGIGTSTTAPTTTRTIINSLPLHEDWVAGNNHTIFYRVPADSGGNIYLWGKGQPGSGGYANGIVLNGLQVIDAADLASPENQMLSFSLPGVSAVINETAKTVTCSMYGEVNNLAPTLTMSSGATCSPASGVATDFTTPQVYTVYAEDGTPNAYTVTVNQLTPTLTTRGDGKTLATFTTTGGGIWTVPAGVSTVEALVIGGGGSGGGGFGSGGGAGGMYYDTLYPVVSGSNLQIAVGSGGAAKSAENQTSPGTPSSFDALIANGGTGGGSYNNGGDQGGYSTNSGVSFVAGNLGGHSAFNGNFASGGGAGAAGTVGNGQPGGAGLANSITGAPVYYGGGGGAITSGLGGVGGGGFGGNNGAPGGDGAANTGSGGGGGHFGFSGGGGSGVVILAYQASSSTVTTTDLVSNDDTSTDGESITFTATVKDGGATATAATGSYEFKIDGTIVEAAALITGGVATYTTNTLTTGAHSVVATYSGDAAYGISAATITQTNITPRMLTFSFPGLGAATISGGDITITLPYGTNVTSLAPTFTTSANSTSDLASGDPQDFTNPLAYTLTSTVDPLVTKIYTVTVTVASGTELVSSDNPSVVGQSVTFTATVKADGLVATDATGDFAFRVNGTLVDTVAVSNGIAAYTTNSLPSGVSTIEATYSGDGTYTTSSASLSQTNTPAFPAYSTRGDGYTLATFQQGSGTWTIPAGVTSVEVLVVGGGGGTTASFSSGSGAGGMYQSTTYSVTPEATVSVAVGAGGINGNGSNSVFGDLIAYGGTPGLGYTDGGDQGGYSLDGGATIVPGNPGMHYSPMDGNWCTGGGAGHAGYKGDSQPGGIGLQCAITGSNLYYAGGGGGNAGGVNSGGLGGGGGGPSAFGGVSGSGMPNTGGGGGGGWGGGGGAGGSGVVIVAYLVGGATPYDTWSAGPFANAFTDTDPGSDPDGDGQTNHQEFAFGLDPTTGTSVNPIIAPLDKGTHKFRYTRYAPSGLDYTVWDSTDLQDWGVEPAAITEVKIDGPDANGVETWEVTLTSPPSGGQVFVRVRAQ